MARPTTFIAQKLIVWRYCALVFATAAVVACAGCAQHETPLAAAQDRSSASEQVVSTTQVQLKPWPRVVRAQGSLVEDERALIGAKVAGRIKEIKVDLGSAVEEGQVIAFLEPDEFDLRVQQAEAQVLQARAAVGLKAGEAEESLDPARAAPVLQEKALMDEARLLLNRRRALKSKRVITTEEFQQSESVLRVAEAKYESALNMVHANLGLLAVRKAELATARQTRLDSVFRAPFAGVIDSRNVAPGSFVNVGDPVASLVRTHPLRFRAAIPERRSTQIRVGQDVRVFVEGEKSPVVATITRVSPSLDLASRSLLIEADIDNVEGRFRTGLFAEGEVVVDMNDRALAVPESSTASFAGVDKVWVVREGVAVSRRIRIGRREGGFVEVLDGLKPDEVVISNGQDGRDGPVRVAEAPATERAMAAGQ
jgi:RND family efflux transporter MFP subunit